MTSASDFGPLDHQVRMAHPPRLNIDEVLDADEALQASGAYDRPMVRDHAPIDTTDEIWKEQDPDRFNRYQSLLEHVRNHEGYELTDEEDAFVDSYYQQHAEYLSELAPDDGVGSELWLARRAADVAFFPAKVAQAGVVDPLTAIYSMVDGEVDPVKLDLATEQAALGRYLGGFADSYGEARVQATKGMADMASYNEGSTISEAADIAAWVVGTFNPASPTGKFIEAGGKLGSKLGAKVVEKLPKALDKMPAIAGQATAFGALSALTHNTDEEGNALPVDERLATGLTEAALFPLFALTGMARHKLVQKIAQKDARALTLLAHAAGSAGEGAALTMLDGELRAQVMKGEWDQAFDTWAANSLAVGALAAGSVKNVRDVWMDNAPLSKPLSEMTTQKRYARKSSEQAFRESNPGPQGPLDTLAHQVHTTEGTVNVKEVPKASNAEKPGKPTDTTPIGPGYNEADLHHLGLTKHQIRARMGGQLKKDPVLDLSEQITHRVREATVLDGMGENAKVTDTPWGRVVEGDMGSPSAIYRRFPDGMIMRAEAAVPDAKRKWEAVPQQELDALMGNRQPASDIQRDAVKQHLDPMRQAFDAAALPREVRELGAASMERLLATDRAQTRAVDEGMQLLESGWFAGELGRNPANAVEQLSRVVSGLKSAALVAKEQSNAGVSEAGAQVRRGADPLEAGREVEGREGDDLGRRPGPQLRAGEEGQAAHQDHAGAKGRVGDRAGSMDLSPQVKEIAGEAKKSRVGMGLTARAVGVIRRFGEPGEKLARALEDYSARQHVVGSEALAKAEPTWKGLDKGQREILGKLLDGLDPKGATPDLRARAAKLREVLDAPQKEAIAMGLRTHELKGTAMPTRVLKEFREEMRQKAREQGLSGDKVDEILDGIEGTKETLRRLNSFLGKKEGYLEGSRRGVEEHMRNWDVAEVIPDALFDSHGRVEGAKIFGNKFEKAADMIARLDEGGASSFEQRMVRSHFEHAMKAAPREGSALIQNWSRAQTAMKLSNPISWLKNGIQPLLTSGGEARGSAYQALISPKGLPLGMTEALLITNGAVKKLTGKEIPDVMGIRARIEQLVAEGAIAGKRGMSEYADQASGLLGKASDMALAGFSAVEVLNQGRAAIMAKESMSRDLATVMKRHQELKKQGKDGIPLAEKLEKLASTRRLKKRLRLTNEQLIDKLTNGERLSGREMQEVVYRTVADTQFVMDAATSPIFWHNPYYRALMKFKPFTLNQVRWVGSEAISEARNGNPGPLANLMIWGMLGQEVVDGLKDALTGSNHGTVAKLEEGLDEGLAMNLLGSMINGAGLPIADFTFGGDDWLYGPGGSNIGDAIGLTRDAVMGNLDSDQIKDFILDEVSLVGTMEAINPLNMFGQDDMLSEYKSLRAMAFDARDKAQGKGDNMLEDFILDATDTSGFARHEMSRPYEEAAEQIAKGRIEDAASTITDALLAAEDEAEVRERITGFRRQASSRGPLAPIPLKHRADAKAYMGERAWEKLIKGESAFRSRYGQAVQQGVQGYLERKDELKLPMLSR